MFTWTRAISVGKGFGLCVHFVTGAANPLPIFKSKNMHQKTWNWIRWQIRNLEDRDIDIAERMMGLEP